MLGYSLEKIVHKRDWLRLWRLYRSAFPADERKPFAILIGLWKKGRSHIWCVKRNGRFAGFASTLNGDPGPVMIDYLAICPNLRDQGLGGMTIRELQRQYSAEGLFVEIESVHVPCNDREDRIRRRAFYLRSGFTDACVLADVFGVPMELLTWRCCMDYEGYHRFYHDYYSPWAASHLKPMAHPFQKEKEEIG